MSPMGSLASIRSAGCLRCVACGHPAEDEIRYNILEDCLALRCQSNLMDLIKRQENEADHQGPQHIKYPFYYLPGFSTQSHEFVLSDTIAKKANHDDYGR